MAGARADDGRVELGRIVGLFGVQGWVKVYSYARPREAILRYGSWWVGNGDDWHERVVQAGRVHGRGIVAQLEGCTDRTQASELVGTSIAVPASRLAPLPAGEYYWMQLEGATVLDTTGRRLGIVSHLFETGANDVMAVKSARRARDLLIPFVDEVIRRVDIEAGVIVVDWDPDF